MTNHPRRTPDDGSWDFAVHNGLWWWCTQGPVLWTWHGYRVVSRDTYATAADARRVACAYATP